MIPLRDEDRPRTFPWATLVLIGACAAVFAYQLTLRDSAATSFAGALALDPARLGPVRMYTLVTSAFVHATWAHLLFNLLFLWVFGPGVEERAGGPWFLALYLGFALAAAGTWLAAVGAGAPPLVGASGAVSGVLGAALVLRPRARVRVLVLAAVVPVGVTRLPSALLLLLWLVAQVAGALSPAGAAAPVAWTAHLGGFVAGAVAGAWLRYRKAMRTAPGR